ncbi:pilus assembly protein [Shimia sp. R11_0]|uniref:Flp pilus assembly protein TadG n=1 Tax=Shimia marina TaxID=321267 RepID=A0A0P1ERU0_9RHOB|nr:MULTISPECIES: hypothetical protein [Shimia]MBO9479067.1 pilus assembly protein [Shimia sp. R11_0]CUH53239.1 hypothetical protein SHM7688_02692 [Shimia marina]SFD81777.1 hypothetical protein SAMN04488037_102581 [Shimia marina]
MMRRLLQKIRSFHLRDDGTVTVQFVIMFPFYMGLFMSSVELGLMTLRYSYLERSLDMVVRDIRLSTGAPITHDAIVSEVCARAGVIPSCSEKLKLEMVIRDPRNWVDLPAETVCTDSSEEAQPVTVFEGGRENDMMVLRACAKVTTIFPGSWIGSALQRDNNGDYALVVSNAFVQEPR